MKSPANCPPDTDLQQLLTGSLSDDRVQECVRHMDACVGCQTKIEEIATEGTNLSTVVKHLNEAEPDATSAYWPALKNVDTPQQVAGFAQAAGGAPPAVRTRGDVSLSFLQPASDSVYLGRLAHFDIMRVLGRGGMGLVLEAFDSRLRRNVALKVLDPELSTDDVARQRFCREARAAASITHENVVAVHQVEKAGEEGVPFIVMQLIAGESLEQRLQREKKLPLREIVRIGMQAAQGLAAAHAQGLIHRDIKPGNVLLESPHDRVKLTDFGLARVEEDVKLTRTGFVSGTPLYMSPEQALGEEGDPRSDLFSLGAVLYEMSTGEPPFTGGSALAILKQISETKHRPVRQVNPQVPEWLAKTVDRLLAKKPNDRIQTAAHLAELFEFEWALLKTTSEDVPTVCQEAKRRQTVRNRWIAGGIGAAFLAVGMLTGMFFANRGGANRTGLPPVAAAVSSAEPLAVLSANAGPVWSVSFDAAGDTMAMGVEDGSVRLWDLPSKSVKSTWNAHRGMVFASRFSPSGQWLATAGDDGEIKLWNRPQAEPVQTFKHANAVRSLVFSPDEKKLYAGDRGGGLRVWAIGTEKSVAETVQPGAIYAVALSPDGETLATAGSDKVVRLLNAKNLTEKLPLEGHAGPVYSLSFRPDGRRLASVGWDKTVRIWDTAGGAPVKSWEAHGGDIWSVAYSPDGKRLATGGKDGAVIVWDAESGKPLATYLGHTNAVHTVAFNHDGTLLASGGRDGAARIWKMERIK
ncbi:MAG: serine/threonine protein kinase [Planctomycetia bacterium]|nr:serine/threonine protein kinase [Planctomycetia bacterium]